MKTLSPHETAVRFFRKHAGYSYAPGKETPRQGRDRCARSLARAEREAAQNGATFRWSEDDTTNLEFADSPSEVYRLWACVMRDSSGKVVSSLCGIDLGSEGHPDSDPYARVVRAELASEIY